jgi:hypothetical protein
VKLLAKKEALKILAKAQRYADDDVRKIFLREDVSTPEDEVQVLKELAKKKKDDNGCEDRQHCAEFFQIPEAQLLAHLKDGWEIVKELKRRGHRQARPVTYPPVVF